jgi:hypothetical protein
MLRTRPSTRGIKLAAAILLLTTPTASAAAAHDRGYDSPQPPTQAEPCIAPAPLDGRPITEERCIATAARMHALSYEPNCPLRRIGDQLVRCDNLTGAGIPAPSACPSTDRRSQDSRLR